MKNPTIAVGCITIVFAVLFSCNTLNKKSTPNDESKKNTRSFSEQLFEINNVSSNFAKTIKNSNLEFIENIVNDPYHFHDYRADINISAANIGIYSADAQYLNAYSKSNMAYHSSKSAQRLLELIRTNEIDTSLSQIQKGYSKADSILFKFNDALKDSSNSLTNKQRKKYLISLAAGSFIERNYIVLSSLSRCNDFNNPEIKQLLVLLKTHNDQLEMLLSISGYYADSSYNNYLRNDLINYNNIYLENTEVLMQNNKTDLKLTLNKLLELTSQMRNYIIFSDILIPES